MTNIVALQQPDPEPAEFYRYEDVVYASMLDESERPIGYGTVGVELRKYRVVKRTAKGVWLDLYGDRKFVLNDSRKRFALPTVELARESFIARKWSQIRIYRARISQAEKALSIITGGKDERRSIFSRTA